MPLTLRARAPLRISFGGGGTDVSPYADERGGLVLNATIGRHAYATLVPNDTGTARLRSLDFDESAEFAVVDGLPGGSPAMALAGGVFRAFADALRTQKPGAGFDLFTHTDCPPGSGLGASSTMVVALIGAFESWLKTGLDRYEIARLAYRVEREDLGMKGGRQDQYCAAFGGFNFMEFRGDDVLVNPLRIPEAHVWELEYALVLAYTGRSRVSSTIIEQQIRNFTAKEARSTDAMDRTKEHALEMKRVLLRGDFHAFGELLHDAWLVKQQMAGGITNPHIDTLYEAARAAGALGGKVSGAGGGGFMFFFTEFDRRHAVEAALTGLGAEVVPFAFTSHGLETWTR